MPVKERWVSSYEANTEAAVRCTALSGDLVPHYRGEALVFAKCFASYHRFHNCKPGLSLSDPLVRTFRLTPEVNK